MIKKTLLMPWYLIQLFSAAKSFKTNPVIGSNFLNRMGLHILRVVLSHGIMKFRMFLLSFTIPRSLQKEYYEKGYILLENVLSEKEFDTVVKESHSVRSDIRECIQGDTLTQRIHLTQRNASQTVAINRFLTQKNIVKLFKFAAGKNHHPVSHIQVIKSKYIEGQNDPQKNLHSDAFHPSMKYWFFLQDVGPDMAPFTYVEGSNKLTWKRLKWEYQKSVNIDREVTSYSKNGSFRIDEDELEVLGFSKPKKICVSKNTLVIVNTFGFHKRGGSATKSLRAEIWGISRTNPFNPFIGFDFYWSRVLDNWGLEKLRQLADQKAKKQGKQSSWHLIKSQDLYDN